MPYFVRYALSRYDIFFKLSSLERGTSEISFSHDVFKLIRRCLISLISFVQGMTFKGACLDYAFQGMTFRGARLDYVPQGMTFF